MVKSVFRSTRVAIWEFFAPEIKSPSQCPGIARSSISIPEKEETLSFDTFMNKTKWKMVPDKFKDRFEDVDEANFRVSSPLEVVKSKLYLYLCYPSSKEEDIAENLKEGVIYFGVIDEDKKGILTNLRVPTEAVKEYEISEEGVVESSFTLISCQEQHYVQLFAEFYDWLAKIPDKKLDGLAEHFLDCLKTSYRESTRRGR